MEGTIMSTTAPGPSGEVGPNPDAGYTPWQPADTAPAPSPMNYGPLGGIVPPPAAPAGPTAMPPPPVWGTPPPAPGHTASPAALPSYGQSAPAPAPAPSYGQTIPAPLPPPAWAVNPPGLPTTASAYPPAGYQPGANQPLASWGQRAIGALIDYGAPGVVLGIVGLFNSWILSMLFSLAMVAWIVYNTIILGGQTGVTYGRRLAGTKLVSEATGQPIGPVPALVRHLCHLLEFAIGFLLPLWTAKKQTVADMITKTVVLDTRSALR
jgi:uncharacterized RDD family membrane protein YckC